MLRHQEFLHTCTHARFEFEPHTTKIGAAECAAAPAPRFRAVVGDGILRFMVLARSPLCMVRVWVDMQVVGQEP